MDNPHVSVVITTYNHEKYIVQAIESVLMQKTDFDYEILIGEDDSSDNTREICKEYAAKYPDQIRLFLNDRKNVIYINGQPTGRWNFINLLKNAKGKYIAICEGDDYWTNPHKLQKQVAFLDNNSDFVICYHRAGWLVQDNGKIRSWNYGRLPQIKKHYTDDDLLEHSNFIPTCSVVFLNILPDNFPDWYYEVEIGDLPLYLMLSQHGKIEFLDEGMAVRRWHQGGLYGGSSPVQNFEKSIRVLGIIGLNMGLTKRNSYHNGLSKLYGKLTRAYREEHKYIKGIKSGLTSILVAPNKALAIQRLFKQK